MKSRLQIAGHPIHAMIVAYPIGLYTAGLVCDLLYVVVGDAFWFRVSFWAIVFGLVTHLGAAATGSPDFLAVMRAGPGQRNAQRAATSHLIFALGLLVVQGLNLGLRNGGQVPASGSIALPLVVNFMAVGLLGVLGWYGGELVYRHHVGVDLAEPDEGGPHGRHKGKKHS